VRLLSALADPTRLGIVTMLSGLDEPLCVCDIVTQFDLGQPTISHHLKVLREAGLVGCEKRGLWVYYWLNRDVFSGVTAYLNNLQRITSGSLAL
jgi:ArsR family transcriptional regulator, arsenate/arsenite/antimonite-responsive transcriptional repressor